MSAQALGAGSASQDKPISTSTQREPLEWIGLGALFALAPAALIYLSFNAGGYFPSAPAFVAIIFAQALLVRSLLAERPFEGLSRTLAIPLVALVLYAVFQLISASWAHATARVLDAYDRTLLYVLVFVLFGAIRYSRVRMSWLLRATFIGMSAVCLIGLISRVLPHTWPTSSSFFADRLNYPLTYWNAEGMVAALAIILGFHLSADRDEHPVVRVIAAAALPGVASTLLLTFSRGSLGVTVIGLVAYCLLTRVSTLPTVVAAVAAPVAVALHAAWDATALATNTPTSAQAISQGHHVARVVALCMLAAGLLRALLLLADRGIAGLGPVKRPPARRVRVGIWIAVGAAVLVVALALGSVGVIERNYNKFVGHNHEGKVVQTRERLSDPTNNGRVPLWNAALDIYDTQTLRGTGAGTFQQFYPRYRTETGYVTDAHSLYLQSLSELGVVGGVLIVLIVGGILGGLARRIRGPNRAIYAALFAISLAWAIHQAFDWDWQMPAVTLPIFALGGLALARPLDGRAGMRGLPTGRAIVALGWLLVAVCPLLVSISYTRLQDAGQALSHGDCKTARHDALSSLSASAERPQTYALLGVCDLKEGFGPGAVKAMGKAVSYEPGSWEDWYWLGAARAYAGMNPHVAMRQAQLLNPHEQLISGAIHRFAGASPENWEAQAGAVVHAALRSGKFSITSL
ncbi:MAG TPA: O-antigen ligase family protein [Solirubrobacteraceae bacterium]